MTNGTVTPRTLADEARAYASRGIKVFPLWWIGPDGVCACSARGDCASPGKHPRTGRGGVHAAAHDGKPVGLWWALWPNANIGLPAGGNNLAIIDVDPAHGGDDTLAELDTWCRFEHGVDIMATRTVRTGSGGLHLYFRAPAGGVKTAARSFGGKPGVDTRGRGGYVVAPPSLHISGGRYELINNGYGLAPWPYPLTRLMEPEPGRHAATPATPARGQANATRWAQAALDNECAQLVAIGALPEGSGKNQRLFNAALKIGCKVAGGHLDERAAAEALYNAALGWHGHGDREIRATIESGFTRGKTNPHPGPAGAA